MKSLPKSVVIHSRASGGRAPIPLPPRASPPPPVPVSEVLELTAQNVAATLDGHPFAVVSFGAASRADCRAFAPVFAAAAAHHPDRLFAHVDVEAQPGIAAHFDVRSVPALMVFRGNIVVFVHAGPLAAGELDEVLAAVQALDMAQVQRKVAGAPTAQDDPLSIATWLRPAVRTALAQAGPLLAAGQLVVVPDAFDAGFADRMHACLDGSDAWRPYEGYHEHFHYHHHNLYGAEDHPPDLDACSRIFDSPATRDWAGRLSGRTCSGPTEFSASLYLPGDHSLPHNDVSDTGDDSRQVAYVWHLARDWRSEWGGALYWCARGDYLPAAFNTLFLFNVGPTSNHFVTQVSPYARGKRLAINGWWTGPGAAGGTSTDGPGLIDPAGAAIRVY